MSDCYHLVLSAENIKDSILTSCNVKNDVLERFCNICIEALEKSPDCVNTFIKDINVLHGKVLHPVLLFIENNKDNKDIFSYPVQKYIDGINALIKIILNRIKGLSSKIDLINSEDHCNLLHSTKRCLSFQTLDFFLNECKNGRCLNINEYEHYLLTDISISSYIENRIYFYGIENEYENHYKRKIESESRIENIISCKKKGNCVQLDCDIFLIDLYQISIKKERNAKNRKAYWAYMSKYGDNYSNYTIHVHSLKNK